MSHLGALFEAVDAELAHADLLVSHPAASIVGAMSCERRGVPWVVGDLFPILVPTATAPPVGLPNMGARFNLALTSRHYVEPAPDWPDGYDLVGFTPWQGPNGGRLNDDVRASLSDGSPPVVVTLGTSGASAKPEIFEAVASVLDDLGARGVFLTSNTAIAERVRSSIGSAHAVWQFVPLAPLLASARAVVHSGAHGTNALVLTAGLASVIAPCMFDQRWHAQRQEQLGTGIWARHRRHLCFPFDSPEDEARRVRNPTTSMVRCTRPPRSRCTTSASTAPRLGRCRIDTTGSLVSAV